MSIGQSLERTWRSVKDARPFNTAHKDQIYSAEQMEYAYNALSCSVGGSNRETVVSKCPPTWATRSRRFLRELPRDFWTGLARLRSAWCVIAANSAPPRPLNEKDLKSSDTNWRTFDGLSPAQ